MGYLSSVIAERRSLRRRRPLGDQWDYTAAPPSATSPITQQSCPPAGDWGKWCDCMWPPNQGDQDQRNQNAQCHSTPFNPGSFEPPWTQLGAAGRGLNWAPDFGPGSGGINAGQILLKVLDPAGIFTAHSSVSAPQQAQTQQQAVALAAQAAQSANTMKYVALAAGLAAAGSVGYVLLRRRRRAAAAVRPAPAPPAQ